MRFEQVNRDILNDENLKRICSRIIRQMWFTEHFLKPSLKVQSSYSSGINNCKTL